MKTKVAVDCSAIFHQVINRMCGYNGKRIPDVVNSGRKFLTKETERKRFLQEMHNEITKLDSFIGILKTDGIFLVFDSIDSKSFRYNILSDYKGGKLRNKEQVYCKDEFKKCVREYYETVLENGFKVILVDTLEADDIFLAFKNCVESYDNICIVTPDSDMEQLIDYRTFLYNPILEETKISSDLRKSATPISDKSAFETFFESNEEIVIDQGYEKFFSNSKLVNPKASLAKKILLGDNMDNIPSCFRYRTKKGTSEFALTDTRIKQLIQKYPDSLDSDSIKTDDGYLDILNKISEVVGRELDTSRIEEYVSMRNKNLSLIDLSESAKYHKLSPEVSGIIRDQIRKPSVKMNVISFYESIDTY